MTGLRWGIVGPGRIASRLVRAIDACARAELVAVASRDLAQFDSGFAAPDRQRVEIVGADATLVLGSPFLPAPHGPPPSLTLWRGGEATEIAVPSVDQYRAEVENLTAAILDGAPTRLDLRFSRGTIAALVDLDRAARLNAGLPSD